MELGQPRRDVMPVEIEQMRRMNLFSSDDCKKILKRRTQFERKICEISKNQQDFQDYIEHEMNVLKHLQSRRNESKVCEKMSEIEHKIVNRIKYLYETAVQTFPDDTTLCLAYFIFCKQANYVNAATAAVSNMIKNHSHNVEIWQVATKWHAYDRKDISTALNIICKGIAKHRTTKLLYTEAIHLEIQNAGGSYSQRKGETVLSDKQKFCIDKVQTYIREIANYIDDCKYYVELLEYLEEYRFTKAAQNTIIEYLVKNHSYKALTWNMLAQRDKKGLSKPAGSPTCVISSNMKINYINRYKEGLSQVSGLEKEELWSLYINSLIDEWREEGVGAILKEAFEKASAEGYLFEKYYIQWLELVDDHEKAGVVEKGIAIFPQSVELWKIYLKIEILTHMKVSPDTDQTTKTSDSAHRLQKVFKQGVNALNEKSLPLWTGMMRYHLCSSNDDAIEAFYKEGVIQPPEVSDILKPQFIEWLSIRRGASYTREQYFAMAVEKPYCKELHLTMAKLESAEIDVDFAVGDKIHKLACDQFGGEDDDVWFNRLRYYVDYMLANPTISKENEIHQTYADAKRCLSGVLFLDFKGKYNDVTSRLKPPLVNDADAIKLY